MRRDTKIAVGIGVVAVALGGWYLNSSRDDATSDASQADNNKTQIAKKLSETSRSVAKSPRRSAGQPQASVAQRNHTADSAASPTPSRAGDVAKRFNRSRRQRSRLHSNPSHATSRPVSRLPRKGLADVARQAPTAAAGASEGGASEGGASEGTVSRSRRGSVLRPGEAVPSARSSSQSPVAAQRTSKHKVAPNRSRRGRTTQPAQRRGRPQRIAPAAKAVVAHQPAPTKQHVIQSGDTFSGLAVRYLGNAKHASLIAKANPDVDPRRLKIGAKVNIPSAPTADSTVSSYQPSGRKLVAVANHQPKVRKMSPPAVPAARAYTIQSGEGWYDLAKKFLKDGSRWPELYELNRERVSRDPDQLRAGTIIELPRSVVLAKQ